MKRQKSRINILVVCLGNICRSPLAEGILKSLAKKLDFELFVDSAGTINTHFGESPDIRSINVAKKYGIDISNLKARKIKNEDFDLFDFIFVMDNHNFNDVITLMGNKIKKSKVKFLTEDLFPNEKVNIADPYYGNEESFEECFELVKRSCEKIIENLHN